MLFLSLLPPPCLAAYGNVVELRINTKGVGGKLPNFGFVVFDDSDPVQRILGAKVVGACACTDISSSTPIGQGLVKFMCILDVLEFILVWGTQIPTDIGSSN